MISIFGKSLLAVAMLGVPTDKIKFSITDNIMYVMCNQSNTVVSVLKKHNVHLCWSDRRLDGTYLIAARLKKSMPYNEIRDLLFDLAKRKEVIKIY